MYMRIIFAGLLLISFGSASAQNSVPRSGNTMHTSGGSASCVEMHHVGSTTLRGSNGPYINHDYQLDNDCDQRMAIEIKAKRGAWNQTLEPRSSKKWNCTAGISSGDECPGGVTSWQFR